MNYKFSGSPAKKGLKNDVSLKVDIQYNENSDSVLKLVLISEKGAILKPQEQIMINFKMNKALRNFEEYPNDVARGFNIPHMPVQYTLIDKNIGKKSQNHVFSDPILI